MDLYIRGSIAEPLERGFNFDAFTETNFTSSPYVEEIYLTELIEKTLDQLEHDFSFQSAKLNELKEVAKRVTIGNPKKEEYDFRIKNLSSLFTLNCEIERLDNQLGLEKFGDINQLKALLQTVSTGPVRNFLENKINNLVTSEQSVAKQETILDKINNANSPIEIDEIFCELSVENYINLGKLGREQISNKFFSLSKTYINEINAIEELEKLILTLDVHLIKNNKKVSKDKGEMIKQTINLNEIDLIN